METTTLTISSVGQITLPRRVRELLGIRKGDKLDISVSQDTKTITIKKQPTFDEIMEEIDRINAEYPDHSDPRAKYMTVGEMSLEGIKDIEGDTWV